MKFEELNLPENILESLKNNNYSELTSIQEKVIPIIQKGEDIFGCSQTGSGKTASFLIPILSKVIQNKKEKAIIVVPTRELAIQIFDCIKIFCSKKIKKALLIGGSSIREQLIAVKSLPQIIVGTPGRINDFLESGRLKIFDFNTFVLDEMDRMLDMGFVDQINKIVEKLPEKKQTIMFSATTSKKIESILEKYLKHKNIIKIGKSNQISKNISQKILKVNDSEKVSLLIKVLKKEKNNFTIVFVKTKYEAEFLEKELLKTNILAKAIFGDLRQIRRAKIIKDFREKKFNVLIGTDLVARGLDIHHINTIINYSLPQSPEDYIHRLGRCARDFSSLGQSISFCSPDEEEKIKAIKILLKNGEHSDTLGFTKNKTKFNNKIEDKDMLKTKEKFLKNKKETNKTNKKEINTKNTGSGYDIYSLMSNNKKTTIKRKGTYFV